MSQENFMKYLLNLYIDGKLHSQQNLPYIPAVGTFVRFADDDPDRNNVDYKVEKVVSILGTSAVNLYVSKN